MRKLSVLILIMITALMLTGCEVNWFGEKIDTPWYYIAIPVAIIFIIAHIHIMSKTYVCPNCNTEIKLKWYQIYAYLHLNGKRFVICPNCGRKGFCEIKR